jgi:hypothetical protein
MCVRHERSSVRAFAYFSHDLEVWRPRASTISTGSVISVISPPLSGDDALPFTPGVEAS